MYVCTDEVDLPGVKCHFTDLEEVLLRDTGNKIEDSGK